ncbi:MAG: MBL fold metallo-hydrolase [Gemmatimonadetes bacterium]|nr:MBL fold metallo-hydrolase [Gemmatimonadota bacterium]
MIRLVALGSGSQGNAFAIDSADGVVLVDAGFSAKELTRRAVAVGVDLTRLRLVALTHEHGDHTAGAQRLARRHGAPIAATEGTLRAIGAWGDSAHLVLRSSSIVEHGGYQIECCRTVHDALEPAALVIEAAEVRVGFGYDFGRPTAGLRHLLRDCDALVVESNYDDVMLRTSGYPPSVQHRIAGSGGHLSNRSAAELVAGLYHEGLSVVVLAHLSQHCNAPDLAREAADGLLRARGFAGILAVAAQHTPTGPFTVKPSFAKHRVAPQVELEFS